MARMQLYGFDILFYLKMFSSRNSIIIRLGEVRMKLAIWKLTEKLSKDKSVKNIVFKNNILYRVFGLAWNCKIGMYGDSCFESNDPCHVVSGNTEEVLYIINKVEMVIL